MDRSCKECEIELAFIMKMQDDLIERLLSDNEEVSKQAKIEAKIWMKFHTENASEEEFKIINNLINKIMEEMNNE